MHVLIVLLMHVLIGIVTSVHVVAGNSKRETKQVVCVHTTSTKLYKLVSSSMYVQPFAADTKESPPSMSSTLPVT